jgi:chaperone LolA
MKQLHLVCFLLAFAGIVNAQTPTQSPVKNDAEAKKILDAVSTKFKSYKTVKATFTYKVENSAGKTLSSKTGNVQMKGTKYRVTIVGQEIFCDGVNIWTYDKAANEVTITKFDNDNSTLTPQKLFTNFYDQDFLYKLNGEKKQGTRTIQEIEMTPTDKSKPFHKVFIYIDKAGKTLSGTRVLEKSGSRYSYTVNTLTPNSTIDDKQFVFDPKKYPGVEVIEL